jgi:hypothetical protein
LRALFHLVRRLISAAVVLTMLLCAAEVALRISRQPAGGQVAANGPAVPSRLTMYELPSLSIVPDPASGGAGTVRINSLGLRGPEVARPKPPGVLRIVCLGDETTLGLELAEEETYPAQLAGLLRDAAASPVEVVNAGLPGGCPLTAFVRLRQSLDALAPDVVVLHVDVTDALDDQRCRPYVRVDAAGLPLAVMHPRCCSSEHPLCRLERDFAVLAWARGRMTEELLPAPTGSRAEQFRAALAAWSPVPGGAQTSPTPRVLAPLGALHELSRTVSAELVLATCPDAWQCAELLRERQPRHESARDNVERPSAEVHRAAKEAGIPYVDATAAFLAEADPELLYDHVTGRLSAAGHRCYAEALARFLLSPPGSTPADAATTIQSGWSQP